MVEQDITFVREPKKAPYGTVAVFEDLVRQSVGSCSIHRRSGLSAQQTGSPKTETTERGVQDQSASVDW
jgi:hypothetical protein